MIKYELEQKYHEETKIVFLSVCFGWNTARTARRRARGGRLARSCRSQVGSRRHSPRPLQRPAQASLPSTGFLDCWISGLRRFFGHITFSATSLSTATSPSRRVRPRETTLHRRVGGAGQRGSRATRARARSQRTAERSARARRLPGLRARRSPPAGPRARAPPSATAVAPSTRPAGLRRPASRR